MKHLSLIGLLTYLITSTCFASDIASNGNTSLYSEFKRFQSRAKSPTNLNKLWDYLATKERNYGMNTAAELFSEDEKRQAPTDFLDRLIGMFNGHISHHDELVVSNSGCLALKYSDQSQILAKRIMVEYIVENGKWKIEAVHYAFGSDNKEWSWLDYFSSVNNKSVCHKRKWFSSTSTASVASSKPQ